MIVVMSLIIAMLFSAVLILLVVYAKKRERTNLLIRLRKYTEEQQVLVYEQPLSTQIRNFIRHTAEPISKLRSVENYNKMMKRAGLPITGGEYVIILVLVLVIAGALTMLLTLNFVYSVVAALVVDLIVLGLVSWRINRRLNAFTDQLSDCLITLADSLKAGFSIGQAMEAVAREMEPPISDEFNRAAKNIRAGVSIEEAILDMNERIGSNDFDLVVTAILIQRQIGGNLANILLTIYDTISERTRMKREARALTAQGRASAKVIAALPFIITIGLYFFDRDYLNFFVENEVGKIAAIVAVISEIIGIYVIKRITDLDA